MGRFDALAALDRADYVLGRLRGQKMSDAVQALSASDPGRGTIDAIHAEKLLRQPDALRRVDEFVGDHGMDLGRHLGAGAESLVFEVVPRAGGDPHVLKVRPDSISPDEFAYPKDVPGIVPYWATASLGADAKAALQPKAAVVFSKGAGLDIPFNHAVGRVHESLLSRGWNWGDGHRWNIGLMPDGQWGAIDGFIHKAHPSWSLPQRSPEEAIRMLRMTPLERAAIYGGE